MQNNLKISLIITAVFFLSVAWLAWSGRKELKKREKMTPKELKAYLRGKQ